MAYELPEPTIFATNVAAVIAGRRLLEAAEEADRRQKLNIHDRKVVYLRLSPALHNFLQQTAWKAGMTLAKFMSLAGTTLAHHHGEGGDFDPYDHGTEAIGAGAASDPQNVGLGGAVSGPRRRQR